MGNVRFLVPVALIAALAYKNLHTGGGGGGGGEEEQAARLFNYVPQDEFWAATLGFLSYRVPMLAREVGEIVSRRGGKEDGTTVGGSVRAGMALVDRLQGKEKEEKGRGALLAEAGAYRNEVTVVLVSGPEGMGKRGKEKRKRKKKKKPTHPPSYTYPPTQALVKRLVKEDPQERYAEPVWVTTRNPREGEQDGRDYHFIEDFAFQVRRREGEKGRNAHHPPNHPHPPEEEKSIQSTHPPSRSCENKTGSSRPTRTKKQAPGTA